MGVKRARFTIKQVFLLTVLVAAVTSFLVAYGPHLLWASKSTVSPEFAAMREVDFEPSRSTESFVTCAFAGLRFRIPETMLAQANVHRAAPDQVWITFEDSVRQLSLPLQSDNLDSLIAHPPRSLREGSLSQLLEFVVSSASSDFSLQLSHSQLQEHLWALKTRAALNVDSQSIDRYSRLRADNFDCILLSANPLSMDSKSRLRSILVWETTKGSRRGSFWIGDARKRRVFWIDTFVTSLKMEQDTDLSPAMAQELTDEELLAQLVVVDDE